jgi:hypothetical protein
MGDRPAGFYWIRLGDDWEPALWEPSSHGLPGGWCCIGDTESYDNDYPDEVGEMLAPPGAPTVSTGKAEPRPSFDAMPSNVTQLAPRKR